MNQKSVEGAANYVSKRVSQIARLLGHVHDEERVTDWYLAFWLAPFNAEGKSLWEHLDCGRFAHLSSIRLYRRFGNSFREMELFDNRSAVNSSENMGRRGGINRDAPPLKVHPEVVDEQAGGPSWRGTDTSPKRSSRSCAQVDVLVPDLADPVSLGVVEHRLTRYPHRAPLRRTTDPGTNVIPVRA